MRRRWSKQVANYASAILMLLCGLSLLQPSATAANKSPFLFDPSKDWTREPIGDGKTFRQIFRLRCRQEILPKTAQNLSDSSILRTLLLKIDGGNDLSLPWHALWVMKNSAVFFPCGRSITFTLVQKAMQKLNEQLLQEALLEVKKNPDTFYKQVVETTVKPTIEEGGILSIEVEGKPIWGILISTRCDWRNNTIDTSGTVAVRGKKLDVLIRQAVGLKPGDRHPISHDLQAEIHRRVYDLGLFNRVDSGIAIDDNKNHSTITWLICVKQKNEAELAYLEASQINSSASIESARQTIVKYQESIQHFQRLKNASSASKSRSQNLMTLPLMDWYRATVAEKLTEADAFVGLAKTYSSLGEFYQSLNYYNQALSLVRITNERDTEANILTAIADIYNTLGNREQAHRYYKQALSTRLSQLQQQDSGGRRP